MTLPRWRRSRFPFPFGLRCTSARAHTLEATTRSHHNNNALLFFAYARIFICRISSRKTEMRSFNCMGFGCDPLHTWLNPKIIINHENGIEKNTRIACINLTYISHSSRQRPGRQCEQPECIRCGITSPCTPTRKYLFGQYLWAIVCVEVPVSVRAA